MCFSKLELIPRLTALLNSFERDVCNSSGALFCSSSRAAGLPVESLPLYTSERPLAVRLRFCSSATQ